ncbi:PREDICTED: uncharacterized protein LOC105454956 [Wasmannia auropunctata]|uniref:uncharacterized protein LOC105454956 n=1 Tax=Wasmannia auropunctata TaxID=64793 RepID=UPI0005F01B80|nr:PREDICTED: uncharacterized protein LOC105454956 [Wasmannia auropunctata]
MYRSIWNKIIELVPMLQQNLKFIMSDYEKAAMKVIKEKFPNAEAHGCWFHYNQALLRYWQRLGLTDAPTNILSMTMTMALIPSNSFKKALSLIQLEVDKTSHEFPAVTKFLAYVRKTWLPLASKVSVYDCPARTNNITESFHNVAGRKFGKSHDNIWSFLDNLQKLIIDQELKLKRSKTIELSRHRTSTKSRKLDNKILQIQKQFAAGRLSHQIATLAECFAWLRRCDECIQRLEELCRVKRPRFAAGSRQSAVARIARLAGERVRVERRFVHVGAGHSAGLVWREIDTAFHNRVLTGAVINTDYIEPQRFLEDAGDTVLERVRDAIERHGSVKVNTVFNGEFTSGDKRANIGIPSRNAEFYRTSDVREWYEKHVVEATLTKFGEFEERDSGWALSRILNLTVNVNKYNPMHAGCYVEVPWEIATKRAVVNVRSTDNACFAWSVVAALHPVERHADRESSYPHYATVLEFAGIEFPMTLKDIMKFERANDVSINVYCIKKKRDELSILPIRLTGQKMERHVNLLYMQDPRDSSIGHFAWIKNLSRLVSSQLNTKQHKKFFCDRYLHYFSSQERLDAHTVDCNELNECAVQLPKEEMANVRQTRQQGTCAVRRIYADLECVLEKMDPNLPESQHHKVHSIACYTHCSFNDALSGYRCR